MTHAYQEIYLNKARSVLGDAFDYAINICGITGEDFIKLFLASTPVVVWKTANRLI